MRFNEKSFSPSYSGAKYIKPHSKTIYLNNPPCEMPKSSDEEIQNNFEAVTIVKN